MAKHKFQLSESDRQQLIQAYALCQDGPTRTRYQAVRLYGDGYVVRDIEQITGCSRTSLLEWCRAYRHEALHGLVDKRAGGNCAKLAPLQVEDLAQRLHQYTPGDPVWGCRVLVTGREAVQVFDGTIQHARHLRLPSNSCRFAASKTAIDMARVAVIE